MGFRVRKQVGTKNIKMNIGKNGVTSTTFKIAKGITYNSKRGLTLGVPGTGISYNFGERKNKPRTSSSPKLSPLQRQDMQAKQEQLLIERQVMLERSRERLNAKKEYNKAWKEYTGGYNKKSMIAVGICLVLCITPLWPLGLVLSVPSLLWFIIDTSLKVHKFSKYKKELSEKISSVDLK